MKIALLTHGQLMVLWAPGIRCIKSLVCITMAIHTLSTRRGLRICSPGSKNWEIDIQTEDEKNSVRAYIIYSLGRAPGFRAPWLLGLVDPFSNPPLLLTTSSHVTAYCSYCAFTTATKAVKSLEVIHFLLTRMTKMMVKLCLKGLT